ncbi:hypothetical protein SBOR_2495 [Sclerotinia borealis F-4128]|uniref:Uncharacterized protein n=1 Tax=Sclerotinia borealis (strain F-4128) TaxID=1432307 RepID=W9CK06_SCLBF|nr:hypothetical protein SBOR_2495 [Sclerotinia borealis F-4128]
MAHCPEKMLYENNIQSTQYQHQDPFFDTPPTDNDILSQALEFTHHVPPPNYTSPQLPRPIAVPQTVAGLGQPFARVYAPALSYHNINAWDFVEFIDNLNVVATANPPLQIVDLVGGALGMVPHHWAQLAGTGVQVIAKLGTVVVSKSRTDTYMQHVNARFFAPRGLKASITSMEAMAAVLGLPVNTSVLAPVTDGNMGATVLERRMEGIRPYVMETTFEVPPPAPQTTTLAKMSATQVKKQIVKNDEKARKERVKQLEKMNKSDEKNNNDKRESKTQRKAEKEEKEMRKLNFEVEEMQREMEALKIRESNKRVQKTERKLERDMKKLEKEKGKLEHKSREVGSDEGSGSKRDRKNKDGKESKEVKQSKKTLWILIENL